MFFGHFGTYFDPSDGDYSRSLEGNLVNCGIVRDHSGFFDIYDEYYTSELFFGDEEQLRPSSFPLEDTLTCTITKKGRVATTSLTNSTGDSLYSFERKSAFIYAYTSGLHFWYSAFQNTQFTVEVSTFSANLVVEQRDWRREANLDKMVNIILAAIISLVVLALISTTVIVIIRSKSYKTRKAKEQQKEQRVLEAQYHNFD